MASHVASLVSTATAKATDQPVTQGSSFANGELPGNNANFVKTYDALVGDKGRKHLMPRRGIAIICCMDARLDPNAMCGLEVGDAHIIRDCGYSHASTTVIQKAIKARTPDAAHPLVDAVSLQEFSDPKQSVREDVAFLRTNPLVHPDSMVSGWYYSVKTGELQRVC
ncbi:hypothetical protein JCM8202v2_001024 [Rhodotorula sphaerocarpa]